MLILDPRTYSVHELNETAAIVARLCDGQRSCEQIVAEVATDHEADVQDAAAVVYRGLKQLEDQGLLELT